MLKRLQKQGITIVVSTPYMDEASLCDQVALIQDGSIMQISTPEEVVAGYPLGLFAVSSEDIYQLLNDLQKFPDAHSVFAFGHAAHLSYKKGTLSKKKVEEFLIHKGHQQVNIEEIKPNIEDCFMELMDKE